MDTEDLRLYQLRVQKLKCKVVTDIKVSIKQKKSQHKSRSTKWIFLYQHLFYIKPGSWEVFHKKLSELNFLN